MAIAFQNALTDFDNGYLNARVRLTLVDPAGNLAAYSVPQGNGNYGNVQITEPEGGHLDRLHLEPHLEQRRIDGAGSVEAGGGQYTTFGRVSSAELTLAPGQSRP